MTLAIASPLAGWATPLDQVPDLVFAERMLGDGVAIDPVEGRLTAPQAGKVVSVHPSGHAVTLALDSGPVLLMHIGLDTVGLGGMGFLPRVKEGDRVEAGATLIQFDLDRLARVARSLITPVIVTNGEAFALRSPASGRALAIGETLFELEATGAAAESTLAAANVSRTLLIPLAHGLHARPAARIAKIAASGLEIVGPDGRAASGRSAVAMLALALPHGAEVTVRGPDRASIDAVADLLESGMGELLPVTPPEEAPLPASLPGIIAVPGTAIGPAFRLAVQSVAIPETGAGADAELTALDGAKAKVRGALETEMAAPGIQADIAAAHRAFLDDPELDEAASAAIAGGASAGSAWRQTIAGYVAALRAAGSRFAERIDDLVDLERRVIAALYGEPALPKPPAGAILIANELLPSQLIAFADAGLAGIATGKGGATSHVAIIAAGMGLPMLVSLGPVERIAEGTTLVIDGGRLAIDPDAATLDRLQADTVARATRRQAATARAHETAITSDGTRIEVFANLGSLADARAAAAEGAEGCGLLRTEFLFLDRASAPSEDEQHEAYQAIADALDGRPLIVRTLDIGADKPAHYLPMAAEENPALGLRGIRLQLAKTELLDSQLRALLRVKGPLKIMLPMVADLAELQAAKEALAGHAQTLGVTPPELGIMVETPAAALIADSLAAHAAFFSIGSNDLTQYALARDRTNAAVAAGLDGLHPAVLRLIDATVGGGKAHGRWTGVCGGLAAEAAAVPLLIGLGVTELSVPVAAIAEIKALVRTLSFAACRALAQPALAAPDAATVRALVENAA